MARIHTMEDDITFERVRHLPKRTHVYSVHRKLSWECQKEIKLFERDNKVTTYEMKRSQSFMKERLSELQTLRRQSAKKLGIVGIRRMSCPPDMFPTRDVRPLNTENLDLAVKGIGTTPRSQTVVKFASKVEPSKDSSAGSDGSKSAKKKELLRSISSPRKGSDFNCNITGVPLTAMMRRKTMPALEFHGNTDSQSDSEKLSR